jgi:DNA-binding SARP family transcriptional activator/TolB-like protein
VTVIASVQTSHKTRPGQIKLFGTPSFEWKGQKWPLPAKAFALIALLSAEPSGSLSRNQVRTMLWQEFDREKANANLRQTLSRVRRVEQQIGATLLIVEPESIALNSEMLAVDLTEPLAMDIGNLIEVRNVQRLEEFIGMLTGDLFSGTEVTEQAFDDWRMDVQDGILRNALRALTRMIQWARENDDSASCERFSRKLLELDPTVELAYRSLMEIYEARGERTLALQTYQKCRDILRKELQIEPEPETRRLAAALGFLEPARVPAERAESGKREAQAPAAAGPAMANQIRPGAPRVLLLAPFVVADDPNIQRVATALVGDVISGLSRYRSFTVLAPHTSLRADSLGQDPRQSFESLNVRYTVDTTIKPVPSGLSADFRLKDYEAGVVLWSSEIGFSLAQLPLLFGQLSHQVVYSLADAIEGAELRLPMAAEDPTAYRLYLEGRSAMSKIDLPSLRAARQWYRKSIDQFAGFAPAIAGLARTLSMERLVRGLTDDEGLKQALTLADRASELDPFDGRGMRERGFTCLYLRRHDESLYSFQRAAELNPSDADLFADYADALAHSGRAREGLDKCLRAMALNPLSPDYYHWILGSIYYQTEDYQNALKALDPVKHHPETARLLAACSAMAGQLEDARLYADVMRETYPDFQLDDLFRIVPDKYKRDTQHVINGLKMAGLT